MKTSEYAGYDALGLAELIATGQVTQAEVSAAALSAIEQLNPTVNALVEVWGDEPQATDGPFKGVPFLVKDLGLTAKGRLNELGSRLAAGCVADEDSTLMSRLRQAGLVTLGRTTTPELAASTTTEALFSGPTRNPWDLSRSAGGSSGGSAAAVAAGLVPAAHATDGGGSIRVPAASTGLFGLKPSRGRVPMGPAVDEVWAGLAVHGVVSRTVRDSAALLDAIEGPATDDPFEITRPQDSYLGQTTREPGALRIGLLLHPLNGARCAEPVANATRDVAAQLQGLGHIVEAINLDIGLSWEGFVEMNGRFWSTNTAAWINAIAAGTGRTVDASTLEPATLALHEWGCRLTATDLLEAMYLRNLVTRSMGRFFSRFDILLSPTLPELPSVIGRYNEGQALVDGRGWMDRVFAHSPFTALANVTGSPSMSVPLALDTETGLPIGMQFSAGFGREDRLLRLGAQLERALPWSARKPGAWAGNL